MTKLEKAKGIVKEYYDEANGGLFFCRNWCGDTMKTVYKDDDLTVDICYGWSYFEVFGLNKQEQEELEKYYDSLSE